MKRKILNERCIRTIQWILWIGCVMFLGACGEKNANHDMAADIDAAEKEQVSQESKQEDVDESLQTESIKEPEESERIQDDGEEEPQDKVDYAEQNEERFYEVAEYFEVDQAEAADYYQKLCKYNVFRNHTALLSAME